MTVLAVLNSELTTVLTDRRSVWWHIGIAIFFPILLLLLWPVEPLNFFLSQGKGPGTLTMIGTAAGIGLSFLSGGFALGLVPRKPGHVFVHWYRYTPVEPHTYLVGRLLFHLIHSVLLIFLILPSLFIAAIPSYATTGEVLVFSGFIFISSFLLRASAEAGRRPDKATGSLALLSYVVLFLTYLLVTFSSLPDWSYLTAILKTSEPSKDTGSTIWKTLLFLGVLAVIGSIVSLRRLYLARRVETAGSTK